MNRTTYILLCLSLFLPSAISLCSMAEAADARGKIPFITAHAFKKEVVQSAQPVMLDVCGTWCAPCKTMSPIVEQLANKYSGKVKFYKIDIDDEEDLAESLGVESLPTFVLVNHGQIVKTAVGNVSSEKLDNYIGAVLKAGEQANQKIAQPATQSY